LLVEIFRKKHNFQRWISILSNYNCLLLIILAVQKIFVSELTSLFLDLNRFGIDIFLAKKFYLNNFG